jgi:PPP family 3-phenylpropionic acid transporter
MLTSHNIATTYLLQIIQSLGGDSRQLGIAMAIQAIVEVPVLFSFSKLVKRVRPGILMLTASVGYAVKALLYAVSGSMLMLYLTQTTQMFSFAIFASASVYYTSQSISEEDQTTGQAYMGSMMSAGMVVGSLLGGWLLQLAGIATMLIANLIVSLLGVIFAVISVTRKGLSDKQ